MAHETERTDPKLWEKVKEEVTEGDKGGKPGQWSARKAQLAVNEYKHEGGGYKGKKTADNHLTQWGKEEWGTKSGGESGVTGERYLPKKARDALSDADYKRTTKKKRADSAKGKQFSAQPKDVADKTAPYHESGAHHAPASKPSGDTRAALYAEAKARNIPGRSAMSKDQLAKALGHSGSCKPCRTPPRLAPPPWAVSAA